MRTVIKPIAHDAAGLSAFVNYLHIARENERVNLARKIHDELGGLLVSAAMDLGWAESHLSGADLRTRLRRLGANLASAIAMKRHMIEQLRPTLLDNIGLFEALRWYLKHACHLAEITCRESYPDDEVALTPAALSHIFRATQTLLDCTFNETGLKMVQLEASIQDESLFLRLEHEHDGIETVDVLARFPHELGSAAHRVATLAGELSFECFDTGSVFYLNVPLREVRIAA